MELDANAREVLMKRYLLKDDKGKVIEKPEQMLARVANAIASIDFQYNEDGKRSAEVFYKMMDNLEFFAKLSNADECRHSNEPA